MSSKITTPELTKHLLQWLIYDCNYRCITTNSTMLLSYEADVIAVTDSGFVIEYETKISRGDYKADFKKGSKFSTIPMKHELLQDKDSNKVRRKAPNRFYFVVPKDLVTLEEVPEYAGLIYIDNEAESASGIVKIIRKAPRLNPKKVDDRFRLKVFENLTVKHLSLMNKLAATKERLKLAQLK